MRRLAVRVDADANIGSGHLMRSSALASMLTDRFTIHFFCKPLDDVLRRQIEKNDWSYQTVDDEDAFLGTLSEDDIVVIDGYQFDAQFQRQIKQRAGILIHIDDLQKGRYYADLIINHAPGVDSANYDAQPSTVFALGPDYALLRPAFLELAKQKREPKGSITNVFICFGGSDTNDLTSRVLNLVKGFTEILQICVVTGSSYTHLDRIRNAIATDPRVAHFHAVDEEKIASLMCLADLAIVPSSGILFEALASGCHVISGYYVSNQIAIYNGFSSLNAIWAAGTFDAICVKETISSVLNHSDQVRHKVIDGHSKERLLTLIDRIQ